MPSSAIIIPPSETSVDVSIIDTKSYFGPFGVEYFLKPGPVGAHKTVGAAFYCFLVHHKPSNTRLLFDLALRKDVENLSRSMHKSIEQGGWEVNVPTDIADILSSNTVPLESINGIVWSHHHWDHIGDPSTFPSTTSLIAEKWLSRTLSPDIIQIGGYAAVDYFKDGSFYFLDTPGHTIGHVSTLARTTAGDDSTFMLLGGDVAHHAGEFRPSPFVPMPAEIRPDPRKPAFQSNGNG
ncbi:hypothetical protein BFJ70_g1600 [Fusarium oxysporum]|nr:hypothetical protein BFJ70_g1600 [Fusarium oxysporum]